MNTYELLQRYAELSERECKALAIEAQASAATRDGTRPDAFTRMLESRMDV
jgi:hypothetical protein